MGTRALVHIYNDADKAICTIYKHYDGYIKGGLGDKLKAFLEDFKIVNGLSVFGDKSGKVANGIECMAAQLIAHLKTEPGDVYLYPPDTCGMDEEFIYHIKSKSGEPILSVEI